MKIFPLNFSAKYKFKNNIVEYVDLHEIAQGGPEIGKLLIDRQLFLKELFFGGPLFYYEHSHSVLLPVHSSSFLKNGFRIIVIDLMTKEYKVSKRKEKLILFKSINNGVLEYYTDLENKMLTRLDIDVSNSELWG